MTERVVIDASAAVPLLRDEPLSPAVDRQFRTWLSSGAELLVPSLFWLEITNSLLRRHERAAGAVVAGLHQLDELGLTTIDVARPLTLVALDVAERFSLSMYDAVYLALAESLDAWLFTSDRELLAAAGPRGFAVGAWHRLSERRLAYGGSPTWPRYREISAYLAKLRAQAARDAEPAPRRIG